MGVDMLFDDLLIRFFRSRSRCVTIRPTSGDAGAENDRIVFQILFSRSSVKRESICQK